MSPDQSIHREQHREKHGYSDTSDREQHCSGDTARLNEHELIAIDEWLPGTEPTPYGLDLTDGYEYRTRYWRCRNCGQERNRRDEFQNQCEAPAPPTPLEAEGYSIDDARTRRALSEEMDVRFTTAGPVYKVDSESGNTYEIDIQTETCSFFSDSPKPFKAVEVRYDHRQAGASLEELGIEDDVSADDA